MQIPIVACLNCNRAMNPSQNGLLVGLRNPDGRIFAYVNADSFLCPNCGHKVLAFSSKPLLTHNSPGFQEKAVKLTPDVTIHTPVRHQKGKTYAST